MVDIQIQVCGTRGLTDDEFAKLTEVIQSRVNGTTMGLEHPNFHLAHYDWGGDSKGFRGHVNIDLVGGDEK